MLAFLEGGFGGVSGYGGVLEGDFGRGRFDDDGSLGSSSGDAEDGCSGGG